MKNLNSKKNFFYFERKIEQVSYFDKQTTLTTLKLSSVAIVGNTGDNSRYRP